MSGINYLPVELLVIIFQFSSFETRLNCKLVCKQWLEILVTYSNYYLKFNSALEENSIEVITFSNALIPYMRNSTIIELDNMFLVFSPTNIVVNYKFWQNIGTNICLYIRKKYIIMNRYLDIVDEIKTATSLRFTNISFIKAMIEHFKLYPENEYTFPHITNFKIDSFYEKDEMQVLNIAFNEIEIMKRFPNLMNIQFYEFTFELELKTTFPPKLIKIPYQWNIDKLFTASHYYEMFHKQYKPLYDYKQLICNKRVNDKKPIICLPDELIYLDSFQNFWTEHMYYKQNVYEIKASVVENCFFVHKIIDLKSVLKVKIQLNSSIFCEICLYHLLTSCSKFKYLKLVIYASVLEKKQFIFLLNVVLSISTLKTFEFECSNQDIDLFSTYSNVCCNVENLILRVVVSNEDRFKNIHIIFPNLRKLKLHDVRLQRLDVNINNILKTFLPFLKYLKRLRLVRFNTSLSFNKRDNLISNLNKFLYNVQVSCFDYDILNLLH